MVGLMVYQYAAIVYFYFSIGRLESIKQALYELVILPLWKPELFSHEKLLGPQKGVLLYGTPGTGKTMLAKAIIREFGAVFINMRISNLMSKWFGDAQKLVLDRGKQDRSQVSLGIVSRRKKYKVRFLNARGSLTEMDKEVSDNSMDSTLANVNGRLENLATCTEPTIVYSSAREVAATHHLGKLFMSCKLPELLYFSCKYCYCCDNRICQSSVLLNLQELLQSVHNSITFKILPETEIDSSDQE
ncbi:hypothetical protein NC651_027929 [Populus alba x Populus x berolinensis]|nr:hypothetical protein NC651_027929 [Populus alba x Populus x berolinensis]